MSALSLVISLGGLTAELPAAFAHLQRGNIAPVDLVLASIGSGMAVYPRYAKVVDAEGKALTVRYALFNQTSDEVLLTPTAVRRRMV